MQYYYHCRHRSLTAVMVCLVVSILMIGVVVDATTTATPLRRRIGGGGGGGGNVIFVSPFGQPKGNGTQSNPFGSVADALAVAQTMDTVVLLPGAYTGADNFATISTAQLMLTSLDGAAATVLTGLGDTGLILRVNAAGVVIDGVTLTNSGGLLVSTSGAVTLQNSIVSHNVVGVLLRGASSSSTSFAALNTTLRDNGGSSCSSDCSTYGYGAVVVDSSAPMGAVSVTLEQCSLERNRPSALVLARQATAYVNQCAFASNGVSSCYGGAMCAVDSTATVRTSSFVENLASYGGALHLLRAQLTSQALKLYNNSAASSGGGVYLSSNSNVNDQGSAYERNAALRGSGGAFFIGSQSDVALQSASVTGNSATVDGGDFHCDASGGLYLSRCVVDNNSAPAPSMCPAK